MLYFDNRTDFVCDSAPLESIVRDLSTRDVEVILTTDEEIARVNASYRGVERPTDVLSFPLEQMPHAPLGTVMISVDRAEAKARELGHTPQEEITLLLIHGMLHLLGYDHERDNGEMREKERTLISTYGLPESLIERSE